MYNIDFKQITMKQKTLYAIGALILSLSVFSAGASVADDKTTLFYTLPSTTIRVEAEAICEEYTPGIYAAYAKKYLGVDVSKSPSKRFILSQVRLTPTIEADYYRGYIVKLNRKTELPTFMQFTSQGLIMLQENPSSASNTWRFPSSQNNLSDEIVYNMTTTETILYKNIRSNDGTSDKVAMVQSQVVEKSLEKKASETANMIFALRKKRMEIITGDTDATFGGDALRAAIEEITRTENALITLFTGETELYSISYTFDIIPEEGSQEEISIALRMSDEKGLLPASEVEGRPIVIEIRPESIPDTDLRYDSSSAKYTKDVRELNYRIPAICAVRLFDGDNTLVQTRIPIYQKGKIITFPISLIQ